MKLKALIISLAALCLSQAAFAGNGTWSSVTISEIEPLTGPYSGTTNGYLQVKFSGASTGGPSCGSTNNVWAVLDVTTSTGAYIAAILQYARAANTALTVSGIGSCSLVPTIETIGQVIE